MSKITLNQVADLTQSTSAQTTINTDFSTIQTAFDNTLSRDGTVPNQMSSSLDMNSNQILNLPAPSSVNSPARLIDVVSNPTIVIPGTGPWTTYTPTVSTFVGSLTSASATGRYFILGKSIFISVSISITTNGTGASFVRFTLPVNSSGIINYAFAGNNSINGVALSSAVSSSTPSLVNVLRYDGGYPGADNTILNVTGIYESV